MCVEKFICQQIGMVAPTNAQLWIRKPFLIVCLSGQNQVPYGSLGVMDISLKKHKSYGLAVHVIIHYSITYGSCPLQIKFLIVNDVSRIDHQRGSSSYLYQRHSVTLLLGDNRSGLLDLYHRVTSWVRIGLQYGLSSLCQILSS